MNRTNFILLPGWLLSDWFANVRLFALPTDKWPVVGSGRWRQTVSGEYRPVVNSNLIAIRVDHVPRCLIDFRLDRAFVVNIFQLLGKVRTTGHFLAGAVARCRTCSSDVLTVVGEVVMGRVKMLPGRSCRRYPSRIGSHKGILEHIFVSESQILRHDINQP